MVFLVRANLGTSDWSFCLTNLLSELQNLGPNLNPNPKMLCPNKYTGPSYTDKVCAGLSCIQKFYSIVKETWSGLGGPVHLNVRSWVDSNDPIFLCCTNAIHLPLTSTPPTTLLAEKEGKKTHLLLINNIRCKYQSLPEYLKKVKSYLYFFST